jgi:hypothetical protein
MVNQNYQPNKYVIFYRKLPLIYHSVTFLHINFVLIYRSNRNLEYVTNDSGSCKIYSPKRNSGDRKEI